MSISPDELAAAQALLEADAVNLDEVVPEPVRVTVREYQDVPASDGQPARRKIVTRTASIETYVPLDLYDGMLAARAKIVGATNAAKAALERAQHANDAEQVAEAEIKGDEATRAMFAMMTDMVWQVWKLTEPGMTLEALKGGISLKQVRGLFTAFFGEAARRLNSSQETAAPGTSANGSSTPTPPTPLEPSPA